MPTLQEIRAAIPASWVERECPDFPKHDRMDLRLGEDLVFVIRVLKPEEHARQCERQRRYGLPEPRPMICAELETCAYGGYFAPPDLDSALHWVAGSISRAVLMGVELTTLPPWLKPLVDANLDRALAHVEATRSALMVTP